MAEIIILEIKFYKGAKRLRGERGSGRNDSGAKEKVGETTQGRTGKWAKRPGFVGGWMIVDFPKKSIVLVQKQKCGISNFLRKRNYGNSSHSILCLTEELQVTDCSVCESRTAKLRDIVYSLCGSETAELQVTGYSLSGGGTARLKVKALVWKRNCETSSRTKFIVWKRNCVTSKPQYFPCAEAELCHFRAPKHTLFCMRKRNSGTLKLSLFLVLRRNFKPKNIHVWKRNCRTSSHIIICVRKRNFKSHNSLYVESLWFLCNNPKCLGAQAWRPLCQSHLGGAVLNCVILAVAPTGIVLVCSVLIKHDRISWRVTRIRTLGKHHDRRPQGQSFLKGQYVEMKATSLPYKRVLGKGSVQYYPEPL